MPLIHDNPWLVEQLLKSVAQEAGGTPTPPPPDNQQQVADALRALLLNLRNQADPSSRGVIEHGAGAATLGSQNMESMGDFIEWLAKNQTKYGGKQIVYPGNTNSPGEDYDFYKIEPGTKIAVEVETPGGARPTLPNKAEIPYWVQTAALKQYLVALQADEKLRGNVTYQVQLLNLIRFANEQLDAGISETYKEEVKDQQVDGLPPVLDMNNWNAMGSKPLWLHDLKDINTLNAVLGKAPMTAVKVGNHPPQTMKDMHWNQCVAINVIAARARSYLQNASPEAKGWATAYNKGITDIAKSVNCSLSSGSGDWDGEGGGGGEGGTTATATLEQLLGMQVFNARFISVAAMKQFVDSYASWSSASHRPTNATRLKADFDGAVSQAQTAVRNLMSPIMLSGVDRQQFTNLYTTNASYFTLAIAHLSSIVSSAQRAFQDFIMVVGQQSGPDSSTVQKLNRQIAIAQQNINDLMRIKSQPQPTTPYRR